MDEESYLITSTALFLWVTHLAPEGRDTLHSVGKISNNQYLRTLTVKRLYTKI